jgi:hypothetical protein
MEMLVREAGRRTHRRVVRHRDLRNRARAGAVVHDDLRDRARRACRIDEGIDPRSGREHELAVAGEEWFGGRPSMAMTRTS